MKTDLMKGTTGNNLPPGHTMPAKNRSVREANITTSNIKQRITILREFDLHKLGCSKLILYTSYTVSSKSTKFESHLVCQFYS